VYTDTGTTTAWLAAATTTAWTTTSTSTSVTGNWWTWADWHRHRSATRQAVVQAEALRRLREPYASTPQDAGRLGAERQARRALRASADAKAEALLLRHLDAAQQQTYRHYGWFEIDVGGRVYRLEQGFAGNVTRRDPVTKRAVRRYCAHIDIALPMQDNLMSQLLAITHDEQGFLRVANVS